MRACGVQDGESLIVKEEQQFKILFPAEARNPVLEFLERSSVAGRSPADIRIRKKYAV